MDSRYYQLLRSATQEELHQAITDPEDELYDIIWDLFETVVIEPAEIFDVDFRDRNQFRYSIDAGATLEFFPDPSFFQKRIEPNPYQDESDAAGIHLKFSILPYKSCLFSVGFQIWGWSERLAFKKLWRQHRRLLSELFRRAKPMVFTLLPFPPVEHAGSLDEMLDHYFQIRDPENFIALQYSFAQTDESDVAQNFMVTMNLLYHSIRDYCQKKEDSLVYWYGELRDFYSGHLPDLPPPLPCVELAIVSDTE